jgi:hypothetical protein
MKPFPLEKEYKKVDNIRKGVKNGKYKTRMEIIMYCAYAALCDRLLITVY